MDGNKHKDMFGWKKRNKTSENMSIQLEKINQKILLKEWRQKRYWDSDQQYNENSTFQNNERKLYQQVSGECTIAH